jgi:hypothetical protein
MRPAADNFSNDLVSWNQVILQDRKLALDNVKIRPADSARQHTQQDLPNPRFRTRNFFKAQRPARNLTASGQYGGFHSETSQSYFVASGQSADGRPDSRQTT